MTERRRACGTCLNLLVTVRSNSLRDEVAVVLGSTHHRHVAVAGGAEPDLGVGGEELREAVPVEEQVGRDGASEEDVVVQVEVVLGQSLDAVQLGLDGVRVEGGQPTAVTEELAVATRR